MTSFPHSITRPEILALPDGDSAAATNTGFGPDAIKLDANEMPWGPLVPGDLAADANRYPEPQPAALRRALAALYGVSVEQTLVARGADDAIDLLVRTFVGPGDVVAVPTPGFTPYGYFTRLGGGRYVEVPQGPDFAFSAEAFMRDLGGAVPKLVFLCSPNNPTGHLIPHDEAMALARALPDTVVVVDEAYIEFSEQPSIASALDGQPNLAVLRTLSKAWGIAGARVGALLASPPLVALAAKALPPYPLSTLSVAAALSALHPSRRAAHAARVDEVKRERARVAEALDALPHVRMLGPQTANYVTFEVPDAGAVSAKLRGAGVRVRFRPNVSPGCIRLTIGAAPENDAALAVLGAPASIRAPRRAEVVRDTKETRIAVSVDLDRADARRIGTGVPFYDHMLDQVAAHGGFGLTLEAEGDLHIDAHHTIEDSALALGQALHKALGDRRGIGRYGFSLPMDEASAEVLIDLSGRPHAKFEGAFAGSHIGQYPTEMTPHVFASLAQAMGAAIHVTVRGDNDHHKTEAAFKALGRALRPALARNGDVLPSTKGML